MTFRSSICAVTLVLFFAAYPATSQTLRGTVVIAMFTKTDLILAVDSRGNFGVGDGPFTHFDDQCKVAAFNRKVIFAVSGLYRLPDPNGFDLVNMARQASAGNEIRSAADLERLANNWTARVQAEFKKKTALIQGKTRAEGIFAARDAAGHIVISESLIQAIDSAPFISTKTGVWVAGSTQYASRIFAGFGQDTVVELRAGISARAKDSSHLNQRLTSAVTVSDMEKTTMDFSMLAKRWFPEEVGGPIDQVHLGPNGVIWLHQKTNCEQDKPQEQRPKHGVAK